MTELSPTPATGAADPPVANGAQASSGPPPTGPPFESALGAELARTASAEGQEAERPAGRPGDRRSDHREQAQAVAGDPVLAAATLVMPAAQPVQDAPPGQDGGESSAGAAPLTAEAPSPAAADTADSTPGPGGPASQSAETLTDLEGTGLPISAPEAESTPPVADAEPLRAGADPVEDGRLDLPSGAQGASAQIGSHEPAPTPSPAPAGPGAPGQAPPVPARTERPTSNSSPILRRGEDDPVSAATSEGQPQSFPPDRTALGAERATATSTRPEAPAEADPGGARQSLEPAVLEAPAPTTAGVPAPSAPATTSPSLSNSAYGVDLNQAIEQVHATVELAARQGLAQARIQLVPAELGAIRIHLTQTAAGLLARVSADSAAASQALAAAHAELRQSLSGAGIELAHLHVGTHDGAMADAGGHRPGEQATGGPGADRHEPGTPAGGGGGVGARTGQGEASDQPDRTGSAVAEASQTVRATEAGEAEHEAYAPGVLVDVLA